MILLVLSAIQKQFNPFHETNLEGDFIPTEKPQFSWGSWYNGEYQSTLDQYLNDNNGFNHLLIKINNQLDYSLFGFVHAEGVLKGKDDQLFEYGYIRSYTGIDYVGEALIDRRIRRLKFLQNYLKDSLDIDLIFILEPGKASYYHSSIPQKYLRERKSLTNYHTIIQKAKTYELFYSDLNKWFASLKPEASFPLYSQFGTHWSIYGMSVAVDSLLKLIEHTRGINMRDVFVDTLLIEHKARKPDYDMAAVMNLLFRLKDKEPLAYPVYKFEENGQNKDFPMVLVVGDSYYWNIFNTRIPREIFKNEAFWYFGKLVYPDFYYQPTYVKDLNFKEEIEKQDVILLMATERFLYKFDWYLIDELYSLYGVSYKYDKVYDYISHIVTNDEWFSVDISKAKNRRITLEEMLMADAKYMYRNQEPINYAVFYGIRENEDQIRNDETWLGQVIQKAKEKNVSVEEMIRFDAEYMLSIHSPESYKIYRRIHENMDIILKDSILTEETRSDAAFYLIPFDEMLMIKAESMTR